MAFHWEEGIEYARYIDEDRQNIEVLYIVDNPENIHGREGKLHVLPADEKDRQFTRLLEFFSADEIMEMTYRYNKDAEIAFEQQVLAIAQKTGVLNMSDVNLVSEDFINRFVDVLFASKDITEDELKELLFKTKLRLFELEDVKASNNRALKSKLRKSKSLREVFACMFELEEEAKAEATGDTE